MRSLETKRGARCISKKYKKWKDERRAVETQPEYYLSHFHIFCLALHRAAHPAKIEKSLISHANSFCGTLGFKTISHYHISVMAAKVHVNFAESRQQVSLNVVESYESFQQ